MDTFHQISWYAKIAVPFLAIIYAGMLMYFDGPTDRSVYYKQGVSIIFSAIMAYMFLAWH
jgi:hypothetical protein